MSIDESLLEMMQMTVTQQQRASRDGYGKETFSAPVSRRCYVEPSTRQVLNADGETVVTSARVYMAGVFGWSVTDKLILPDGSSPPIIRVATFYDETGAPHHEVVDVG